MFLILRRGASCPQIASLPSASMTQTRRRLSGVPSGPASSNFTKRNCPIFIFPLRLGGSILHCFGKGRCKQFALNLEEMLNFGDHVHERRAYLDPRIAMRLCGLRNGNIPSVGVVAGVSYKVSNNVVV